MQIQLEVEVKSIGFKPVRKNKSEIVITLVAESFRPGEEFGGLLDKNGKVVRIVFLDSQNEEVDDLAMREDRR